MGCQRIAPKVWMMVVVVTAIVVAENGRMCLAFDMGDVKDTMMNTAEETKEKAGTWSDWAKNKFLGKLSINPQDMMPKAPSGSPSNEGKRYSSGKVHAVSHSSLKDSTDKFYAEAKHEVGSAYNSMATKTVRED